MLVLERSGRQTRECEVRRELRMIDVDEEGHMWREGMDDRVSMDRGRRVSAQRSASIRFSGAVSIRATSYMLHSSHASLSAPYFQVPSCHILNTVNDPLPTSPSVTCMSLIMLVPPDSFRSVSSLILSIFLYPSMSN